MHDLPTLADRSGDSWVPRRVEWDVDPKYSYGPLDLVEAPRLVNLTCQDLPGCVCCPEASSISAGVALRLVLLVGPSV